MKSFLCVILTVMLVSLFSFPAFSATAPAITSIGQLTGVSAAGAMDIDDKGNLYVADAVTQEVIVFDKYNSLKNRTKFDNQGARIGATGRGLAVTPDGKTIYFSRERSVAKFNPATLEVTDFLTGYRMVGEIEMDGEGNLYVVDCMGMKVDIYNQYGALISAIGGYSGIDDGAGAIGKFGSMSSITLMDGNKIAVNEGTPIDMSGRLQVFTLDYSTYSVTNNQHVLKSALGTPSFHTPKGMTTDDKGRLYILEYMLSTLRVLDKDTLALLVMYNNPGQGQGKLEYVADAVYDKENKRLFVSCDGGRIEIFGIDGGTNPVYTNVAPTVPNPIEPVGNSVVTTNKPVFTYSTAVDDKDINLVYRIGLYDGETQTETFDTNVAPNSLTENKKYDWAVQAIDTEGASSGWSFRAGFIVNAVDEPPTTPVVTAPAEGESMNGEGVFGWLASTDPDPNDVTTNYLIEISSDREFTNLFDWMLTAQTGAYLSNFKNYKQLKFDGIYYWRVKAMDTAGNVSVASEPRVFIYKTSVLTVNAPEESKVYLGGNPAYKGQFAGATPLELADFPVGSLTVTVERMGYQPYQIQTEVFEDERTIVDAVLVKPISTKIKGATVVKDFLFGADPSLFVLDYDGNGKLDMVVSDMSGEVKVYGNLTDTDGTLSFDTPVTISLPLIVSPTIYFVDWDNDYDKDLLVGANDGTITVFANYNTDTNPKFDTGTLLKVNGEVYDAGDNASPAVLDFDGDNKKDLMVVNKEGKVFLLLNNGTDDEPVYSSVIEQFIVQTKTTWLSTSNIMTTDWNFDGRTDIIASLYNGTYTYYNNGTGNFVPVRVVPFGGFSSFAADISVSPKYEVLIADKDGSLKYIVQDEYIPTKQQKVAK